MSYLGDFGCRSLCFSITGALLRFVKAYSVYNVWLNERCYAVFKFIKAN